MMTMSRAMQRSFSRSVIIGALTLALAALSACSALRLGYNQAPQLAYWWLDGYLEVDDTQAPALRDAIRGWFRWHRSSQLTDYAALLARAQAQLAEPVTPEQVCQLSDEVGTKLAAAFDRAVPAIVELARTVTPEQLTHLQRKYAKNNAKYRDEYLQDGAEQRLKATVKRIVDRAETLYGRLDDTQRERVAQAAADSPFDAAGWLAERQLRQQLIVQTLRRLSSDAVPPDEAQAAVRGIYEQTFQSPREPYRRYQQRLSQYNCQFAARVHNQMTPEQRRRAVVRLKGWEDDLRALAAER
jgi:hypothetical protein